MNLDGRLLMRTGACVFGLLIVFWILYTLAYPSYRDLIFYCADSILQLREPPIIMKELQRLGTADTFNGWKFNCYTNSKLTEGVAYSLDRNQIEGMFLSLVLTPALILVTPTRWSERIQAVVLGFFLLTFLHIVTLVIYALMMGDIRTTTVPIGWLKANLYGGYKVFFGLHAQLLSIFVWALFCLGHWFQVFFGEEEEPEAS